jgi:hypothetical protein
MPEMKNFRTMEEVREDREEYCMHRADVNVHVSYFVLSFFFFLSLVCLYFVLCIFLIFRLIYHFFLNFFSLLYLL